MKGLAIGFSQNSTNLLKRLFKANFVDQIFMASSSESDKNDNDVIETIKIKEFLADNWHNIDLLIFIGSVSASVRLITPFLISKDKDPGVIVLDNNCEKIVPLIGLHQSKAQNISYQISSLIGGEIINTSHRNIEKDLNLDSFGFQWGWKRSGNIKDWSNLVILQAQKGKIYYQQFGGSYLWKSLKISKNLVEYDKKNNLVHKEAIFNIGYKTNNISWHPPILWIGIGCERNTSALFIRECLNQILNNNDLSPLSIAGLASINLKSNESGILELSKDNDWPIRFFSAEELLQVSVPNPSQIVYEEIGTPSVAEASAILASGNSTNLIQEKTIFKNEGDGAVTIAISKSIKQFAPTKGAIHIIGSGPGDLSYLTNDAKKALAECTVWIGYKLYLDLIQDLKRDDQIRIDSELTEERARCEKAINIAQEGIKVAIISSGDAGIYGMGGLLLELLQNIQKEFRPPYEIHPGISSMQMAAALAGAPLMNDFCVISLSDKLTLWEDIENRIRGALYGDLVVVLFNPQSNKRDWQLKMTIDLFLEVRDQDTPVLVARNVGRKNQTRNFFKLKDLPISEIDMFSIIIIGNSRTKLVDDIFINPRGYL